MCVQMRMKLAGQALQLIETAMLGILSHGGPYDSARLLYAYARCKVAAARNGTPDERRTGEWYRRWELVVSSAGVGNW